MSRTAPRTVYAAKAKNDKHAPATTTCQIPFHAVTLMAANLARHSHVCKAILPRFAGPQVGVELHHWRRGRARGESLVDELLTVQVAISLLTLTGLEVVLGIDNIVFIAICVAKVPESRRGTARRFGLALAMVIRLLLVIPIGWIRDLEHTTALTLAGHAFTMKHLLMIAGGLFLIAKATYEIHDKLEGATRHEQAGTPAASFGAVLLQIALINLIFSVDSVITALGMTEDMAAGPAKAVMVASIVLSTLVMLAFAGLVSAFVERHPTVKMLALSFLLLIGVVLVAEGFDKEIDTNYVYFAMGFSLFVELLNIQMRKQTQPVHLHQTYVEEPGV
jgi:predicted tellurium resistance membrane protein TerC